MVLKHKWKKTGFSINLEMAYTDGWANSVWKLTPHNIKNYTYNHNPSKNEISTQKENLGKWLSYNDSKNKQRFFKSKFDAMKWAENK